LTFVFLFFLTTGLIRLLQANLTLEEYLEEFFLTSLHNYCWFISGVLEGFCFGCDFKVSI